MQVDFPASTLEGRKSGKFGGSAGRWRLWAEFGKCWDWTKVAQIQVESLVATVARALRDAFGWQGNRDYYERRRMISSLRSGCDITARFHGRTPIDCQNLTNDILWRVLGNDGFRSISQSWHPKYTPHIPLRPPRAPRFDCFRVSLNIHDSQFLNSAPAWRHVLPHLTR